ncbi:MAG: response regulator [Pseudomonadota bacterium]
MIATRPTILLVDDLDEPRETMKKLLEANDSSVIAVSSIETAIEELSGDLKYHLVVTDINLKNDDLDRAGIAFARLTKRKFGLPVVAYSGRVGAEKFSAPEIKLFETYLIKGKATVAETAAFARECVQIARSEKIIQSNTYELSEGVGVKLLTSNEVNERIEKALKDYTSNREIRSLIFATISVIALLGALASLYQVLK